MLTDTCLEVPSPFALIVNVCVVVVDSWMTTPGLALMPASPGITAGSACSKCSRDDSTHKQVS